VPFELWDAELGWCLGTYGSRAEALAAVRRLLEVSRGSVAPLGLVEDQQRVIATGEALVALASEAEISRA
jgi:hypothetical protein